jgi:hypothetical protein
MADPQDPHRRPDDTISDDVGVSGDQFPHVGAGNFPAAEWKIHETVASRDKTVRQPEGRLRIKLLEVGANDAKLSQRCP